METNYVQNDFVNRKSNNDRWSIITENETRLIVPARSLETNEPSKMPVFFNPAAKFSRDISIIFYRNYIDKSRKKITFADSMCGLGARGLRVGKEISEITEVILNDQDSFSLQITKINSVYNNIYNKCRFYNQDICNFSSFNFNYENRATIVDLDPFGTPSPYIDCILRMVQNEGLVSITATDTAVLLGVYPKVCYRKYCGYPIRSKYSLEIGTRLLLSSIALIGSRLDLYVQPLFVHSYRNYIRVYCKVMKSNSLANKIVEKLGFVSHCFGCGFRTFTRLPATEDKCLVCQRKTSIAGPLWISTIFDKCLIKKILSEVNESKLENKIKGSCFTRPSYKRLKDFFEIAFEEQDDLPFYYLNDEFGKFLKSNTLPIRNIIETLNKNGHDSSRTIFSNGGFKTVASITDIKNCLTKIF